MRVSTVGLVLFNPDGKIFLLQELGSKLHYGKVAGMLSVPIETIESEETRDHALERLIVEEIGVPIMEKPSFVDEIEIVLNIEFTEVLHLYIGKCEQSFVACPNDTDIVHFGWMMPLDILKLAPEYRRLEVEPIISYYLEHRRLESESTNTNSYLCL